RAIRFPVYGAHIHLNAALDDHSRARIAHFDPLLDEGQTGELSQRPRAVWRNYQKIQIANGLALTAQRTGDIRTFDLLDLFQLAEKSFCHWGRHTEWHALMASHPEDYAALKVLNLLFAEAAQLFEPSRVKRAPQVVEITNLIFFIQQRERLW